VIWAQYFPLDTDLLQWLFGEEIRRGEIKSPLDIADVWVSSYSSSTNEIVWGAKVAARVPWVTCVLRLSSYECGMDQPTFTPVQKIVEATGTLYFKFGDLDATKLIEDVGQGTPNRLEVADVDALRHRRAPTLRRGHVDHVPDDDPAAIVRQPARDRCANAPSSTRDDGGLTGQAAILHATCGR